MEMFWLFYVIWNFLVFFIYGADKLYAKKGYRRISEFSLIFDALFLGGVGALFGMVVFNHKTSKAKFRALVPIAVFINVAAIVLLYYKGIL